MPHQQCKTVYKFDELDDSAKEKARDWFRQCAFDYDWYAPVYEDAKQCAGILGLAIDKIYFSGFSSQGDGACFEGSYYYQKGALQAIKAHAPQDATLHAIARDLQEIQRKHFYKLRALVKHRGQSYHEMCTEIDVETDGYNSAPEDAETAIKEALRDFMRWVYRQLEREYEWLNSDEQVDESILANEYDFEEDGRRAC